MAASITRAAPASRWRRQDAHPPDADLKPLLIPPYFGGSAAASFLGEVVVPALPGPVRAGRIRPPGQVRAMAMNDAEEVDLQLQLAIQVAERLHGGARAGLGDAWAFPKAVSCCGLIGRLIRAPWWSG